MKVFNCSNCGQPVYFQNSVCMSCGCTLAYLPELRDMRALVQEPDGAWRVVSGEISAPGVERYLLCQNYVQHQVCNWAIATSDAQTYCRACRQTEVIPDLDVPGNHEAWARLELAKRRLVHSLMELGLPVASRAEDPDHGIAYRFMNDTGPGPEGAVLTGHADGVITINAAEADDVERERRRHSLHEPYRTLLGHFRHEVGHYYWPLLVPEQRRLRRYRKLFGSERRSYARALKHHYQNGPAPDWPQRCISAYASSHSWEDWAETFAHYLHMRDALDTAASNGVTLHAPNGASVHLMQPVPAADPEDAFDLMIADWLALARALNNLSRSLGQTDAYPFVLAPAVIEKLRFVHECMPAQEGASGDMWT